MKRSKASIEAGVGEMNRATSCADINANSECASSIRSSRNVSATPVSSGKPHVQSPAACSRRDEVTVVVSAMIASSRNHRAISAPENAPVVLLELGLIPRLPADVERRMCAVW